MQSSVLPANRGGLKRRGLEHSVEQELDGVLLPAHEEIMVTGRGFQYPADLVSLALVRLIDPFRDAPAVQQLGEFSDRFI